MEAAHLNPRLGKSERAGKHQVEWRCDEITDVAGNVVRACAVVKEVLGLRLPVTRRDKRSKSSDF